MYIDYNELLILNDLSIDREAYREVYKTIEGTNWRVTNRGTVYDSRSRQVVPDILWDGGLRVRPVYSDGQRWRYVNDLVLCAFNGPPPTSNHVPWHRDGDRSNCRLDNLSWIVLSKGECNG